MRDLPRCWKTGKERIGAGFCTSKHARELTLESTSLDPMEVEHGGMSRETGPHRRSGRFDRPINQTRERGPVHLIWNHRRPRLSASDDECIEHSIPQKRYWLVVL